MGEPREIETNIETAYSEGYKDTALGPIPEEWGDALFGELFSIQQGKALSKKHRTGASPKPFLRTKDVLWGQVDLTELDSMDFNEKEVEKLSLRPKDLLICEGGEIGRTAMWHGEIEQCFYQNHVHRLRTSRPEVEPEFYMYWMQAALLLLGLYGGVGNKTTIANLSKARLSNFPVPCPPLPEQKAIAHVLRTVQKAIDTTEQVIESTRELKRSLMKHLFTYGPVSVDEAGEVPLKETEIGSVPEHWQSVNLGALIAEGPQNGLYKPQSLYGEGTPIVRIDDYGNEGGIVNFASNAVQLSPEEIDKYRLAPFDILINRVNSLSHLGKTTMVGEFSVPAVFESNMMRFNVDQDLARPEYVARFLSSPVAREQIRGRAKRAVAQSSINQGDVKSMAIPLPPLFEQDEIIRVFTSTDSKIAVEENRRKTFETLFKTLLHNLMTGKVRVKDLDVPEAEEVM